MRKILRKALAQQKGGLQTAQAARERRIGDEAVLRDAAVPAGVVRAAVEDAIAAAHDRPGAQAVGQTKARREAVIPRRLGVAASKTRRAPARPRESQTAGTSARAGVRSRRVEERQAIEFLNRRQGHVPAQAVVHAQLRRQLPSVAGVQAPGLRSRVLRRDGGEGGAGAVHVTQQEARDGVAAVDAD